MVIANADRRLPAANPCASRRPSATVKSLVKAIAVPVTPKTVRQPARTYRRPIRSASEPMTGARRIPGSAYRVTNRPAVDSATPNVAAMPAAPD
jgi:hypothetical protein